MTLKEKEDIVYKRHTKAAIVGILLMITPFLILIVEMCLKEFYNIRFGVYNVFIILPVEMMCLIIGFAISIRIYQQVKEEIKTL